MSILGIDPGETVGWAKYANAKKIAGGQMDWIDFRDELNRSFGVSSWHRSAHAAVPAGVFQDVEQIVMEDFLIYPEDIGPGPPPPWDPVITLRLIGAIQNAADLAGIPVEYQGAKIKESAEAAGAELDFARPLRENRHENDACRHVVYYLSRRALPDLPADGITFV